MIIVALTHVSLVVVPEYEAVVRRRGVEENGPGARVVAGRSDLHAGPHFQTKVVALGILIEYRSKVVYWVNGSVQICFEIHRMSITRSFCQCFVTCSANAFGLVG